MREKRVAAIAKRGVNSGLFGFHIGSRRQEQAVRGVPLTLEQRRS
jgi:hypothetical protein